MAGKGSPSSRAKTRNNVQDTVRESSLCNHVRYDQLNPVKVSDHIQNFNLHTSKIVKIIYAVEGLDIMTDIVSYAIRQG